LTMIGGMGLEPEDFARMGKPVIYLKTIKRDCGGVKAKTRGFKAGAAKRL